MTRKILFLILLSLFLSSPAWAGTNWCDSAAGCWLFDETSGNANDESSNNYDLTNANVTYSATGAFGTAYTYNGSTAKSTYSSPDNLDIETAFTIVTWFAPSNLTQTNKYIMQYKNPLDGGEQWGVIWEYTNNKVEFFSADPTGTDPRTNSGITLGDTNLHHIAYSYNGTAWVKYLDGSATTISASITFNPEGAASSNFVIGGSSSTFTGCTIDEPAIFLSGLSSDDINDIMDNGLVQAAPPAGRTRRFF